jgi:UDP-N-acetyl-D-glucosamine dehydrogenase
MIKKKEKTAIIGLGYVGLPLLLDFCEAGFQVIGFDIDYKKISSLNEGNSYISYISGEHSHSV